jgi:hypothetical protein
VIDPDPVQHIVFNRRCSTDPVQQIVFDSDLVQQYLYKAEHRAEMVGFAVPRSNE